MKEGHRREGTALTRYTFLSVKVCPVSNCGSSSDSSLLASEDQSVRVLCLKTLFLLISRVSYLAFLTSFSVQAANSLVLNLGMLVHFLYPAVSS